MTQEQETWKEALSPDASDEAAPLDEGAQQILDAILLDRNDLAESRLIELKKRSGETATTVYLSGKLLLAKGETAAAYNIFKRLHFEAPVFMGNRQDYRDLRAKLLNGQLDKARAQWQEILGRSQQLLEPVSLDGEKPFVDIKKVQEELIPDIETCLEIYKKVLEIEPMHIDGLRGLSVCYAELGRADLMLQLKERLQKAQEYWVEMNKMRSQRVWVECKALVSAEKYEEAIRIANIGLDTLPVHRGLMLLKGETLFRIGRTRDALGCADALLRLNESDNEALRLKKKIEVQKLEDNLARGQECLTLAEEQLAGSTTQLKKVKEALDHFLDAIASDPYNLRALVGAYKCHLMSNNPLKARKAMERIREIDANYPVGDVPAGGDIIEEEKSEACFVATRLFGENAPETVVLRRFRDRTLRRILLGRIAISWYRRVGPSLARVSPDCPMLEPLRAGLKGFVWAVNR
ncbi:MAG TPA: CFI-box-CTERM domain-containing protein, partial [Candidatus Ozemobacteraceae bacterium]